MACPAVFCLILFLYDRRYGNPVNTQNPGFYAGLRPVCTYGIAAEQKARTTYDNLLRLIDNPDVREPLKFLRAREIVHFQRFGEAVRTTWNKLRSLLQQAKGHLFALEKMAFPAFREFFPHTVPQSRKYPPPDTGSGYFHKCEIR